MNDKLAWSVPTSKGDDSENGKNAGRQKGSDIEDIVVAVVAVGGAAACVVFVAASGRAVVEEEVRYVFIFFCSFCSEAHIRLDRKPRNRCLLVSVPEGRRIPS
eukprot:GHVU01138390.1.p2 GENE.GHVU01138390.1~~GHVU01138390.1.p2  ORF type:complete len:103 (-),score=13.90 GHVU01138390.1:498-806(-)